MVFIEIKSKYIENVIQSAPGLANFINYVFSSGDCDENILERSKNELGTLTSTVDHFISTLLTGDLDKFNQLCNEFQRRVPDENSPWINNNYLLYLIIVGSLVFKRDLDWLKAAIELRKTENDEARLSREILLAVVTNRTNAHLSPFLLSFYWASRQGECLQQNLTLAREFFVTQTKFPEYSDEFLNLLQLHGFTTLLHSSSIINQDFTLNVSEFENRFSTKIARLSTIFSYFIVCGVLLSLYFTLKKIFSVVPQSTKDWILIILSLLGFTGLEILKGRKSIAEHIRRHFNKFFEVQKLKNI